MEFVTLGRRGVIANWVAKEIGQEAEIEFHGLLRHLEVAGRDLWVRPDYSPLDSEIGEIRFFANNLQHRVFGFFLIDASQYVMLVGAKKKMRVYDPREAIETARKRRKLVIADRSQIREYKDHQF